MPVAAGAVEGHAYSVSFNEPEEAALAAGSVVVAAVVGSAAAPAALSSCQVAKSGN